LLFVAFVRATSSICWLWDGTLFLNEDIAIK
jgi:hypothetical protein